MSRNHHLRNIQRQTKEQRLPTQEDEKQLPQKKEPDYSSYFYRDPHLNNVSPSPSSSNANTVALSKSKDSKKMKATRLIAKNNNSNIFSPSSKKYAEEQFLALKKENKELRDQIVELKVNQFYHFDNKKLKDLITEVEKLKAEVSRLKQENQTLKLQNDFLNRTNYQLKNDRFMEQTTDQRQKSNKSIEDTFWGMKSKQKPQKLLPYYQNDKHSKVNLIAQEAKPLESEPKTNRKDISQTKSIKRLSEEKLLQKYVGKNSRKKLNIGCQNQI